MNRCINANIFAIAALAAIALGVAPMAKADSDKGCSNASLKGTFSHMATGFITAPAAMAGPEAGVGTDTFDGNGASTGAATLSLNGNIIPLVTTGTYKVNPDCTGTYTILALGGTIRLAIVITDSGNEIQAVCVDTGIVQTHIFRRQFPVGDFRN